MLLLLLLVNVAAGSPCCRVRWRGVDAAAAAAYMVWLVMKGCDHRPHAAAAKRAAAKAHPTAEAILLLLLSNVAAGSPQCRVGVRGVAAAAAAPHKAHAAGGGHLPSAAHRHCSGKHTGCWMIVVLYNVAVL
jgi:hypothetical protein